MSTAAEGSSCSLNSSGGASELAEISKAFRQASQRNSLHRMDCTRQTHMLDVQKKTLQTRLDKEEKDVRAQLIRLQGEQRFRQESGSFCFPGRPRNPFSQCTYLDCTFFRHCPSPQNRCQKQILIDAFASNSARPLI